jgi:hypothetical protein
VFTSSPIDYSVTFVDYNDDVLKGPVYYHYGDTVVTPSNPSREADSTYTYTFSGWTPTVSDVTGNVVYKAEYTATYIDYTVKFMVGDTVYNSYTAHYGDTLTTPETNPTKDETQECTYTFKGWTPEVASTVTGDVVYTAEFETSYKTFTVEFLNEDNSVISSDKYYYGDEVEIPDAPTKTADNTYTYAFDGWDKSVTAVTGNATYKATFKPTFIDYTVKFVNEGEVVSEKTYHYGDTVSVPDEPTKAEDKTYTYTFDKWSPAVTDVTGNATYTAEYTSVYKEYTVKFLNEDGT